MNVYGVFLFAYKLSSKPVFILPLPRWLAGLSHQIDVADPHIIL